jgi:spore coat polysaccharide biosynthesis protein SpsF
VITAYDPRAGGPGDRGPADVFIQVRLGSSRLPGKALLPLGGRTCLARVIERARLAGNIRHVVTCTSTSPEDVPVLREADACGAASFTGPLDNCLERFLACAQTYGSDVIVRICGDSPLMPPSFVDAVVTHLRETGAGYARMVSVPVGTSVEAFTVCAVERALTAALDPSLSDDLTYFIGRPEINLLASLEPTDSTLRRPDLILALNRPEDLVLLQTVFEGATSMGPYVTLEDAITFLDVHPDVRDANKPYAQKPTRCDTRLDPMRLIDAPLVTCGERRRAS